MAEFSGTIGHLDEIESPWGNAGGVVKTLEDVDRLLSDLAVIGSS